MPTTPLAPAHTLSRKRQLLADGALVVVTFIWGSTFVMVKDILEHVSPLLLVSARMTIGAVALVLVATLTGRLRGLSWRELAWGGLIGVALWAGYVLQTLGLQATTASNGGFITGLSVVIVPALGIFLLGQLPTRWAWLGVVLATIGLALLSLNFEQGVRINRGDPLVLGGAVAFAFQITLIARVSRWADPLRLAMVQVLTAALLSGLSALAFEQPVAGFSGEIWAGIVFLGIVVTGLTIVIQVSMQRYTSVVHTALIFTLEPVFATIFGFWLQGDHLGPIALSGAVAILVGMLVAELGPYVMSSRFKAQLQREDLEP